MSWKVTDKQPSHSLIDSVIEAATVGLVQRPYDYEITNEETGEVRHSTAGGEKELGENIKKGWTH